MDIDIFYDPVCPWCYIGKRNLEAAVGRHRQKLPGPINIRYRCFRLNPGMPREGMERSAYLRVKFGSGRNAEEVHQRISESGERAGINFRFDLITRSPATILAHRLMLLAWKSGHDEALVQRLFEAYFEEGLDIGQPEILTRLAGDAGLDTGSVPDFLEGELYQDEILQEERSSRRLGVSGVPFYLVAEKYAIAGAQPPEVISHVLELAATAEA